MKSQQSFIPGSWFPHIMQWDVEWGQYEEVMGVKKGASGSYGHGLRTRVKLYEI